MSYRLFAFDIDGTLTDMRTWTVLDSSVRALKMLQEKGHTVVIDTGRGYNGAYIIFEAGIKPDYYIAACGHYIFDRDGNCIYRREMDRDLFDRINRYVVEHKMGFFWKGSTFTLSQYHHPIIDRIVPDGKTLRFSLGDEPLPAAGGLIVDRKGYEQFKAVFGDEVDIVDGGRDLYDINQKGVNKGSGLLKMMEMLGVPKEEVMAFGDTENDIEMLQEAGLGVSFADSQPSVQKICDYLAPAAYDDGVWQALKKLGVL